MLPFFFLICAYFPQNWTKNPGFLLVNSLEEHPFRILDVICLYFSVKVWQNWFKDLFGDSQNN